MKKLILKNASARASVKTKSAKSTSPTQSRAKANIDQIKKAGLFPSSLAKLKDRADELNSITDQTADMVKDVEEFLAKECSIGFEISVIFGSTKLGGQKHLEYRRIGLHYRVAVSIDSQFQANKMESKAWSDCSRALKIESIKHLPALIEAITQKVEDDVSSAEEAAMAVSDVLQSLTGNEG